MLAWQIKTPRGLLTAALLSTTFLLTACGGGGGGSSAPAPTGGTPTPAPAPTPTPAPAKPTDLESKAEASQFLRLAGLGAPQSDIDGAVEQNAASWIQAEMAKPATLTLDVMLRRYSADRGLTDRNHSKQIWQNLITTDDELRQRMMFALSQIFVISDSEFFDRGFTTAHYTDILTNNAFGNYRQLLEDVTYSPAMARYLTYYRNRKGDPSTGRMPDENYAREVLQLFSIGLVELNMDGTPKLGTDGQPIETYTNDDIIGLARVFTGLSGEGASFSWNDQVDGYDHKRLQAFDSQHSQLEKTFLGTTIPPNTSADESIRIALDTISNHPNVPPFISRQLIQRFTASSPSPAYVERVANVFVAGTYTSDNGTIFGTGQRGDLAATLAAILLDASVHDDVQAANEGKVREPVLKFVHLLRAFNAGPVDLINVSDYRINDTRDPSKRLGQHPLRSPSVFNFYRPGFVAPGTETGEQSLTAPELQIVNETASLGYTNFMTEYIFSRSDSDEPNTQLVPDYTAEAALAETPQALVDHLNEKLTGGQMADAAKADIAAAISLINIDPDNASADRLDRVQMAVLMTVTSGAFAVQN